MKYAKGDIVMLTPRFGRKVVAITDIDPSRPKNCYVTARFDSYDNFFNMKRRIASDDIVACKVGELAADSPLMACPVERQAMRQELHDRQLLLSQLKHGQEILVDCGRGPQRMIFDRYLPRGQKYKFTATDGRCRPYKYKPEHLVEVVGANNATA